MFQKQNSELRKRKRNPHLLRFYYHRQICVFVSMFDMKTDITKTDAYTPKGVNQKSRFSMWKFYLFPPKLNPGWIYTCNEKGSFFCFFLREQSERSLLKLLSEVFCLQRSPVTAHQSFTLKQCVYCETYMDKTSIPYHCFVHSLSAVFKNISRSKVGLLLHLNV